MFGLRKIEATISLVLFCLTISATPTFSQETPSDYQEVLKYLDRKGDFSAGVFKVNIPRNDIQVSIADVSTPTPFGFGGWIAMTKGESGSDVMMGDLVLLQEEVNPVMSALLENGLDVTALHNHFFWEEPRLFFMHIHGYGKALDLAHRVKPALDLIGHAVPIPKPSAGAAPLQGTLNTEKIAAIVGHKGEQTGPVYKITIGRNDLVIKEHGATINARMGLNTWAAFYGLNDNAMIAGDVAMLEGEVTPVLKALRKNGLDVVAIHHHMTTAQPTIIFLHYWGKGPAEKLAAGFKAALEELGRSNRAGSAAHAEPSSTEATDIANAINVTAQKDCGCGQCAAKGCDPCHGKNCHYCAAKALVAHDCGCGGCDAKGCSICGPGCDVCKFHLAPSAAATSSGHSSSDQPH